MTEPLFPSELETIVLALQTGRPVPTPLMRKVVELLVETSEATNALRSRIDSLVLQAAQRDERAIASAREVNRLRDEVAVARRRVDELEGEVEDAEVMLDASIQSEDAVRAWLKRCANEPSYQVVGGVGRVLDDIRNGRHIKGTEV